jgi:hypothetical protein
MGLGGVAKRGGHSARGRGRWGAFVRRVEASASKRWPGRQPRAAGGVAQRRRGAEQASRQEVEEKGLTRNFKNFRDLTVN